MRGIGRLTALVLLMTGAALAQETLSNVACDGAVQLGVILPPERFTKDELSKVSHSFLQRYATAKLLFVVFGTTRSAVLMSLHEEPVRIVEEGPGAGLQKAEREAADLRRRGEFLLNLSPVAVLVRVDHNAVLVSRGDKWRGRLQLSGNVDPTVYSFAGQKVSLLHVSVAKASSLIKPELACQVTVYIRAASELSLSACIEAERHFQSHFPMALTITNMRRDPWFLGESSYPTIPALPETLILPEYHIWGSCPKSAIEVEGFWMQQVGNRAAGLNPRFI